MKYIFFGTPNFAAIILGKLIDANMPPVLVVCNPDRPVGRKKILSPPPTKAIAEQSGILILQPEKLSDVSGQLSDAGAEFFVVAAYAKIIPHDILNIPRRGVIGVHPSLLPKYRGPSPIQQAILEGEKETGVTLYLLDEKVDHGPILTADNLQLTTDYNYETLEEKLARMAGELLVGILPKYIEGKIQLQEQDHTKATFTKKFITEDGFVDLSKDDPEIIARKIRALNPEPGVYTIQNGKRLKLLEVKMLAASPKAGEPRQRREDRWFISKTQLEGKKPKEDKILLGGGLVIDN